MSGVNFRIELVNDALPFFAQIKEQFSPANIKLMMDEMGQALVSDVTERFITSQAPDGTTWIESERARDEGGKTLIDDNILASSWTHDFSASGFTVGSPEVYAAIHHYGGETGRNYATVLPARPLLGLAVPQQQQLDDVWQGWIG